MPILVRANFVSGQCYNRSESEVVAVHLEVIPAYGRDYKNQSEVKADWLANKDFQDPFRGSYLNKSDADRLGLQVLIRYARNTKVFAVN